MNSFLQKLPVLGILFLLAFSLNLQAQAPRKFSYQAVVRDAAGNLVINRPVGIRFTILRGSATGIAVFAETHRPTTNNDGLASVEIGGGSALFNGIGNIDWALGPYYLKTEIDPNGATAYNIVGTNQLLSVPYALYAEKSANPGNPGLNTLIRTEPANPRTGTCRFGGVTFYFGLDTNRNNVLDNAEINSNLTKFICNGKDGKGIVATLDNGNGTFTFTYTDGTSFTTSNLTGPQGAAGVGIVSTVDNGNGTFTLNYSNGTSFTTGNLTGPQGPQGVAGPQGIQGQQGPTGANGQNGVSVTNTFVQGDSLYVSLSNGQTLNTGYVRGNNGLNALVKTTTEPAGTNCANGGTKIETGLDNNRNGVLDSVEVNVVQTKYVCNGSGIGGGTVLNHFVPDGFGNTQKLNWTILSCTDCSACGSSISPFTVPAGKNLYITQLQYNPVITCSPGNINANGVVLLPGSCNASTTNPFIVGEGMTISASAGGSCGGCGFSCGGGFASFSGFLVDKNYTIILRNTAYVVPAGKTFIKVGSTTIPTIYSAGQTVPASTNGFLVP
jgi:hypothetical protein